MIVDVHTHILPGIDDGSKSVEMSVAMLKKEAEDGTDAVVCTPHYYARKETVESFLKRRAAAEEKLRTASREEAKTHKMPEILVGAEVACYRGISENTNIPKLCIQGTNLLLLELPFEDWDDSVYDEVEEIKRRYGVKIILAHLERFYMMFRHNHGMIEDFMDSSCYVQVNVEGLENFRARQVLKKWMKRGAIDFLGSDCHRTDKRVPNLGAGRKHVEKIMGKEYLDDLDARGSRIFTENINRRNSQNE